MASSGDLVVLDGEEGVGAFDALAIVGTNANALAEVAKLVCIGGISDGKKRWGVRSWRYSTKLPMVLSWTDVTQWLMSTVLVQLVMKVAG